MANRIIKQICFVIFCFLSTISLNYIVITSIKQFFIRNVRTEIGTVHHPACINITQQSFPFNFFQHRYYCSAIVRHSYESYPYFRSRNDQLFEGDHLPIYFDSNHSNFRFNNPLSVDQLTILQLIIVVCCSLSLFINLHIYDNLFADTKNNDYFISKTN